MQIQTNKKIFLYLSLFVLLGTLNNKYFLDFKLIKIQNINVYGVNEIEELEILKDLRIINSKNIFFLDNLEIKKILDTKNVIDNYTIKKKYPSSLEIKINKTRILANYFYNNQNYFLGSNGKLIETDIRKKNLPSIFGKFDNTSFFNLLDNIENSKFDFSKIKNLFFFKSGRWDIETNNNVLVKLPKNNLKESLDLSFKILDSNKFNKFKILDLRQKNQVIIDGR